ncbi:MAG: RNA methyltransferase, partial [Chitinophagales bacterium]
MKHENMSPERKKKIKAVLDKRQYDLTVVLENIFDPHNYSAVLRSCDAVGIYEVYILITEKPVRKYVGRKSSASAYKWIKIHYFDDIDKCMQEVCGKYKNILSSHLESKAQSLYDFDLTESTALLFGNEQVGLSDAICKYANGNFVIPQMGMIQSLNISVACAVSLYEAFRQKNLAGHYDAPALPREVYDKTKKLWFDNKPLSDDIIIDIREDMKKKG